MVSTVFAKGNKKTLINLVALRKAAQTDKAPRVALRIQGIMLSLACIGRPPGYAGEAQGRRI